MVCSGRRGLELLGACNRLRWTLDGILSVLTLEKLGGERQPKVPPGLRVQILAKVHTLA